MTYSYLILSVLLLLVPFAFTLDHKVFKPVHLRQTIVPSVLVTIIFSEVAVFFALKKIWVFNSVYVLGKYYRSLPVEGYLFIFALSFAGLGIYNYLNEKFVNNDLQKYSLALSNLILGIFVAILFFSHRQWFPLITVVMALVLLFGIEYLNRLRFMYRFYRAYVISLVLFYVSYGLICNLPIITYNKVECVGAEIGNIPIENNLYLFAMLLLGTYLVEYFKFKAIKS